MIIEQICQRTGHPKPYQDFINILVKAVKNSDPNIFIDLLGRQDLSVIIGQKG
jgi:hypothetical protein